MSFLFSGIYGNVYESARMNPIEKRVDDLEAQKASRCQETHTRPSILGSRGKKSGICAARG